MYKELFVKCDCNTEDCNLYLYISPIGTVAIAEGQNTIAGLHLSNDDIDKVIAKLTEIKSINKDNEEWVSQLLLGIDKEWLNFLGSK